MIESDPDIAVLANRLGLRKLNYRTFARPSFPAPVATVPVEPVDAPPEPDMAVLAEPPVPVRPPQPFMPPPAAIIAAMQAPAPQVTVAPPLQYPLLMQALTRRAPAPETSVPAAAQPFLNLRHVIAETSRQAEH